MTSDKTGFEAGFTGDEQIRIALQAMVDNGGGATMSQLYEAIKTRMSPASLSEQGRASLRFFINRGAVRAGYVHPHDKARRGWRVTTEGRDYLRQAPPPSEQVVNVDTEVVETAPSNAARGTAFELYVLSLLKAMYPHYAWFHQGRRKAVSGGCSGQIRP